MKKERLAEIEAGLSDRRDYQTQYQLDLWCRELLEEVKRLNGVLTEIGWNCREQNTKAAIGKARGLARAALPKP